jgi:hypothetical protein
VVGGRGRQVELMGGAGGMTSQSAGGEGVWERGGDRRGTRNARLERPDLLGDMGGGGGIERFWCIEGKSGGHRVPIC